MTQTLRTTSCFSHPPLRADSLAPRPLRPARIVRMALLQAAQQLLSPRPQSVAKILEALHAG